MKAVTGALIAGVVLAGCGGGGGGGGGSAKIQCTSPASASGAIDIADVSTAQKTLQYVFDTTTVETLSYTQGKLWMVDIGRTITGSGRLNCPAGGSANITDTDPDHNALQVGDALSLAFSNCKPAASGSILNGTLAMRVTSVTGNPYTANSAWNLGLEMVYTNLQTSNTAAACGTVNATINTTGAPSYTGTINGSAYTVASNANTKRTLSNYTFSYIEPELDPNTGWPQQGGSASLSTGTGRVAAADTVTSSINGFVDFQITAPLTGTYIDSQGNGSIGAGALRANGANNSSVTMTAVSTSNVDIDVGSNGSDGLFPWSSVLP